VENFELAVLTREARRGQSAQADADGTLLQCVSCYRLWTYGKWCDVVW